MQIFKTRVFWFVLAGAVLGLGAWQRAGLLAQFYTYRLVQADDEARPRWAGRIADLGEAGLEPLLATLAQADARACGNARAGLALVGKRWGIGDPSTLGLAQRLQESFTAFSMPGKAAALELFAELLDEPAAAAVPAGVSRCAAETLRQAEALPELRREQLRTAGALLARVPAGQWLDVGRRWVEAGLRDGAAEVRVAALQLLAREPLQQDGALLRLLVPLLHDREAEVRRRALLLLAQARDQVPEDQWIVALHDPDFELRHLCETALRSRGLQDNQITLARFVSDERPSERLRVLQYFQRHTDLEPAVWLRRLSRDASPAVRAASIRAAAQFLDVDLAERLREMAQEDPSETVRLNAAYYLAQRSQVRTVSHGSPQP